MILWPLLHFEDTGRTWAAYLVALLSGLLDLRVHLVPPRAVVVVGYLLARACRFRGGHVLPGAGAAGGVSWGAALHTYGPGAVAMIWVWYRRPFPTSLGRRRAASGRTSAAASAARRTTQTGWWRSPSRRDLAAFLVSKLAIPVQAAYSSGHAEFCRYIGIGGDADSIGNGDRDGGRLRARCDDVLAALPHFVLIWALSSSAGAALLPANPNLHRYYAGLP